MGDPELLCGSVLHDGGKGGVGGGPCVFGFRSEVGAEALLEGPEQGGTNGFIVLFADAIGDVTLAELFHGGNDFGRFGQAPNRDCDHLHEFLALFADITFEKRFQLGIQVKEFAIKKGGGSIADGDDLFPGSLDEVYLFWCHKLDFLVCDRDPKDDAAHDIIQFKIVLRGIGMIVVAHDAGF